MVQFDFRKKITFQRPYSRLKNKILEDEYEITRYFESDRGRIIHSAAIRRLQQKTQVFPLERNAAVRSRLTHSLEVQQAGRYIAKEVLRQLSQKKGGLSALGLQSMCHAFESLVEMACLLHDIGNPPFGHFGEAAINNWFAQNLRPTLVAPELLTDLDTAQRNEIAQLNSTMRLDLVRFDGNAQAIRLVHTLLQLNLSFSQVACILKYTAPAWQLEVPTAFSTLTKKAGYYLSEEEYINQLRQATDLERYHRFPLTYIMEAADDISYCVADLDDAVEKSIFSIETLYGYLKKAWGKITAGDIFARTVERAWADAESSSQRDKSGFFFVMLRVHVQDVLVKYAAKRFVDHLSNVYHGCFNQPLIDSDSCEGALLRLFKSVAREQVFTHPEVEQLELQGDKIIQGLLDSYKPLLTLNSTEFTLLARDNSLKSHPIATRLYHKLSKKHRQAYKQSVARYEGIENCRFQSWEFYYRCRLIQDYVSGMTDNYALDEYLRLMALKQ